MNAHPARGLPRAFSFLPAYRPPMGRDYYEVLGVSKTASADEIKKAYRGAARKLHPDVNKAPDAQKKFTEVQNAYDVLSDDAKRRAYDQFGEAGVSGAAAAGGPGPGWGAAGPGGYRVNMDGSGFDAEDLSSMFETFFGGMGGRSGKASAGRKSSRRAAPRHEAPAPEVHDVRVDFMKAVRGGAESLRVSSAGASRSVDVKIPAGIPHGATMRLRGLGPMDHDGDPTDLMIRVLVEPHALFRRGEGADAGKGLDIFIDVPLTIAEATLGATVHVPTLGGSVDLKIPPGTASGKKLRVRGQGIAPPGATAGDLYAVIQIVPPAPADLTSAETEALRGLSGKPSSVRSAPPWRPAGS